MWEVHFLCPCIDLKSKTSLNPKIDQCLDQLESSSLKLIPCQGNDDVTLFWHSCSCWEVWWECNSYSCIGCPPPPSARSFLFLYVWNSTVMCLTEGSFFCFFGFFFWVISSPLLFKTHLHSALTKFLLLFLS